ncbi:hydrogenobyrinate a,c-diamide synthase [Sphaerisporangium siamense]|uniref:Hydrogenobyrinate a,c-diamide synthase n=1 Tax=Sphaerisporangium siamense TaxID=795645 RepID=A0A7W7D7K4_9ACTN|nr:cobyrinate a,c-diamide synthase [Sphaerisporangium siamense]MBB4701773.1 cobyrinic acid a,c-diamide synthase [Sphaerisporangium siamense]GII84321.1 hydrogenobyrinate a,c-diamide synthase [Sphaerisporangium siamense]
MVEVPRLVIAAPASGAGKTTVATGVMAALAAKGVAVSPHKVGPDYIDPGYHALAAGRPGRNLDPWLTGEDLLVPLFLHGAAGADIAVIEGVMGLFDGASFPRGAVPGADADHFASTAHVARVLGAPVVLVVDVSAQAGSVAALVHGFVSYDTRLRVGGVILNRVGSPRHEQICRDALDGIGLPVLGAIPRTDIAGTPSRHLGLVPPAERSAEALRAVATMGDLITATCDLPALTELARSAPPLTARPWNPREAIATTAGDRAPSGVAAPTGGEADVAVRRGGRADVAQRAGGEGDVAQRAGAGADASRSPAPPEREVVVAVAGGKAFTFGYAEQAELIAAAGATVAVFDPLTDERLPEGTAALVLPGGFPEVYAGELSANEPLRRAVAAFGGPIAAECAGLLYLCRELDGRPMCGVVDATAAMTDTLTLGYRGAVAVRDSVLTREGERYHGHEFHRTRVTPATGDRPLYRWREGADGFGGPRLAASYLHLHWAGSPHLALRLVAAARNGEL